MRLVAIAKPAKRAQLTDLAVRSTRAIAFTTITLLSICAPLFGSH